MKILLTYYHATWCVVCEYAEPVLNNLVTEYRNQGYEIELEKVDLTNGGSPDYIEILPTLIVEGNGNWIKLDGGKTSEEIRAIIQQVLTSGNTNVEEVINQIDEALNPASESIGNIFTPVKTEARKKGKLILITALSIAAFLLLSSLGYLIYKRKKK